MATPTIMIDLGEYGTRPLPDVPPELGPGLAAVIREVVSWNDAKRAQVSDLCEDEFRNRGMYERPFPPSDRLEEVLGDGGSDIGTWSCQDGAPDEPIRAGAWLDALCRWNVDEVARAVLARDFNLITKDDFDVLTKWWTDAGLPMPEPRIGAYWPADEAEAVLTAEALRNAAYETPGWPLAAVTVPNTDVLELVTVDGSPAVFATTMEYVLQPAGGGPRLNLILPLADDNEANLLDAATEFAEQAGWNITGHRHEPDRWVLTGTRHANVEG